MDFKAISVNERPAYSICISCIWWDNSSDYYVTLVDAMRLIEQLVELPGRFFAVGKNRLRRRFEDFHSRTISKKNEDHSRFFKTVMAFGHPKLRRIERDFKVFPWSFLEPMLKKIIPKYSVLSPEVKDRILRRKGYEVQIILLWLFPRCQGFAVIGLESIYHGWKILCLVL